MGINTLVIEPENVLYTHLTGQYHLNAYLQTLDIKPRHPQIVEKALKAARFDVMHGRISRDTYYDAILRFHGVPDDADFDAGRYALLSDGQDIVAKNDMIETLERIYAAGISLSLIVNSAMDAHEIVDMLANVGFVRSFWGKVVSSSEAGAMIPDPAIFEALIESPTSTAVLSARPIPWLAEHGIPAIVYESERDIEGLYTVHSPEELLHLLVS